MSVRLKQLREAAGMTQAELAAAAGVPLRTYQTWEQGVRTPLFDAVAKVAEALDVSLDDLAGIGHPPRRKPKGGAKP
jgi:transcriptional regulator with XRE-family HTH domain